MKLPEGNIFSPVCLLFCPHLLASGRLALTEMSSCINFIGEQKTTNIVWGRVVAFHILAYVGNEIDMYL